MGLGRVRASLLHCVRSFVDGGAPVSTGASDFGKEQAERVYRLDNAVEN